MGPARALVLCRLRHLPSALPSDPEAVPCKHVRPQMPTSVLQHGCTRWPAVALSQRTPGFALQRAPHCKAGSCPQAIAPTAAWLNGAPCQLELRTARPRPQPASPLAAAPAPAGGPLSAPGGRRLQQAPALGAVSISNGRLYGVDGQPLTIRGANWRGPHHSMCRVCAGARPAGARSMPAPPVAAQLAACTTCR